MAGAARCAIYTRKSSEEGLDQAFNSLQAQREACEAFVRSQVGEGWRLVPTLYDDGGWSGGSMDRPALQQILKDVRAGLVDTIVVYKVDRLTRSLADFAKIVETLDQHEASFVSVTQPFNTTTSMGRLTLNVLLSFAQFEREVTGERIRDKIAASKAKGMWMGGTPPLGYDAPSDRVTRALRLNDAEAETVRLIFAQYLRLKSVHELQRWLATKQIKSKLWVTSAGREIGGAVFSRGALFHLLKNRVYLGEIVHKTGPYASAHPPIVDEVTFEVVQRSLASATRRRELRPKRRDSMLLTGLLFDADGHPMSPTISYGRNKRIYRYYVSAPLQQGGKPRASDAIRRLPADEIDQLVRGCAARVASLQADELDARRVRRLLSRVEVHPTSVQLVFDRSALFTRRSEAAQQLLTVGRRLGDDESVSEDDAAHLRVTLPMRMQPRGGRTWIVAPDGRKRVDVANVDPALVRGLRAAHALLSAKTGAPIGVVEAATLVDAPESPYQRKLIRLAFLSPQIQRDILEGRQPPGLTLEQLIRGDIAASWKRQVRELT